MSRRFSIPDRFTDAYEAGIGALIKQAVN